MNGICGNVQFDEFKINKGDREVIMEKKKTKLECVN